MNHILFINICRHQHEDGTSHNYNNGSHEDDAYRKSTLQRFTKDVFIKGFSIIDFEEKDSHVGYVIRVLGKTKYLVDLMHLESIELYKSDPHEKMDTESVAEFLVVKRYSELLTFHKLL